MLRRPIVGWKNCCYDLAAAAVLTAASLLICGYRAGPQDMADQQWTVCFKFRDPALYPYDPYVAAFMQQPGFFFWLLAKTTTDRTLPAVLLILHVLSQFGTITGMIHGARALNPRRKFTPLLAGMLICGATEPLVGGASLHADSVDHATVAAPLAIWSLALLLHGRWRASGLLAGLCSWLHPLLALCVWAALGGAAALQPPGNGRPRLIPRLLAFAPGLLLLALPLGQSVYYSLHEAAEQADLERWLLQALPFHFYPFSFNAFAALRLCTALALLLAPLYTRELPLIRGAACGVLAWLLLGVLGTEIIPTNAFIKLQTARAAALLLPLLFWALARRFDGLDTRGGGLRGLLTAGILLHFYYFNLSRQHPTMPLAQVLILNTALLTVLLFVAHYLPAAVPAALRRPPARAFVLNLLLCLALAPLAVYAHVLIRVYLLRFFDPFAASNLYTTFAGRVSEMTANAADAPLIVLSLYYSLLRDLALAAVAITLIVSFSGAGGRWEVGWPGLRRWSAVLALLLLSMIDGRVRSRLHRDAAWFYVPDTRRWDASAAWIQRHTPKDAQFLSNHPAYSFFRTRARRTLVYDSKMFLGIFLDPGLQKTIAERARLLNVTLNPRRIGDQQIRLNGAQLLAAAKKLHADYVLCPPDFPMPLTPVYADGQAAIYRVQHPPGAAAVN